MSSNEIVFGGQEPAPPSLQEAIESNRRKALFQSISVAANQDPKHVAEAMRYGFSPMAPREALDQERKARNVRKVYDSVLDYPVASSFFQDPAFASIAIKDADNIGILENLARTAVSVPTGLAEAGLSILELTQGQASAFVDYLRIKIKQNAWEHMTPEQRRQFRQQDLARRGLTEYPSEFRPLGEMVTTKMRRGLQELTKDFKPQAKTLFGEALISAGTSIGQFAVLLPFGPAGILTGFGALSFGQGLESGRQAGLETGDQIRKAAMDAIAEIGFAALPLQRLFASTKSGSSFLRSFWEFSAAEVPAEMATTLTQSFNRWARIDSQRGQSFDDWLSGLGREEALTVLATLMSSAGFSALAHRAQVQITNQAREQGLAEARARGIAQMADRLRELELTSEAPEAARQLMNGILQEASDVDRLRVEASRLAEAIEQVGVDKVRAALPGVVEALQQSGTEPGVEAEISPGDYLVAAAQVPELRAALEPHIRVGDSEYSSAEVEQARAETDAYLSALQQEFDQQVEQARQREADRLQIERNVISQIYGEDAARALTPEQAVPEPEAEAQPEPAQQPEADVASIQAAMDAIPPEVTQVVEQLSEQLAEQAPAEPAVEAPEAVSEAAQPVDERQDFLGWFGTSRARTMAGIPARLVESSPGVYTKSGEGTGGVAVSIRAPLELTGRRARRFAESESVRREVLQQAEQSGRDGVVAYVKRRDAAGRTVEETVYAPIKQDQVRPMPASMDITPAVQAQAESIAAPMTDQQIEQLDADYAKAVKRKDWARAKEIVDIFARQMARTVLLAHHGLSEGFLENHSFDPTRLGKFTGAPSARLGFFMSRGSATPRAYAKHNLFPKKRAMDAIRKMADIIGGLYSRANLTPETFRQLVDQLNQSGIIEINKSGWARVSSVASPEVRQLLERELGISPGQEFSFVELKEYLDFAARNSAKPDAIASRWAGRKSMKAKLASIGVLLTTTAANFNQDTFNMTRRHVDTQYAVAQQLNALLQLLKTQAYRSSDVVGEVDADTASRIEQEVDKVAGETNEVYNEIFEIYGEVTTTLNLYAAMNNPLVYDQGGEKFRAKKFFDVIRDAKNAGHDGVIIKNTYDGGPLDDVYVVFNPNQIKSAEAVVLDDNKQVVPPSQRFDVTTTDIRFAPEPPQAPGPQVTPEQIATQARLFSIMFSRLAQTMGVSASDLWSRYGVQILSGQLDGLTEAEQQAALQRPGAYLPKKMTVVLNQSQTASTLIHELSHHWMHVFETVASDLTNEQADAIRQEFQVLLDWFGVKDIAAWQALPASEKASHHETLAYNFEDYLATGKAPTNALRGVFRKIKDWFAGLYSDLRGHLNESYRNEFGKDLPALTDDVRMLFDRMLGSEVAIARAKQTELAMPLFTTRDESGMDEEEWAELQEAQRARDEEAIDKFRAQSVRDIQWSRNAQSRAMRQIQREASERRGEIRKEVETELRSQPVYRAISFLRSGELRNDQNEVIEHEGLHRMNAEVVKDEFGQEVASALGYGKNGMLGKDGLHPDLVASVIGGFQDGSDLVRQLASAKPLQQAVAEISEQLMQQRHAELVDPKLIEAAAANAIRNQHHVRFLTKVLRFVSRATQPESVMALAAKYAARRTLERMTIRDIRPDRFSQAERRTGKEANKAWKSGDEALTINLLRRQLGQAQLANESRVVREEVDKLVKYLRRLSSANKRKSVGADYADYIDMVLGKVVVDKVQLADLPARAEPKTLADYASEAQSESFATVATPEYVAELSAMQATDYRDMRYEQLLELVDLVKEIEHRGRLKHQGKMEFLQQSQQEVVASLTGAVIANAPETKGEPSVTEQSRSFEASRAFYKYGIQQTTMATKAWVMDGGDYGPWFDLMVNTSSKLMDLEIARRAEHTQKLEQILMPLFGSPLYGTGQFRERLGRRMNTQEMFILACNLGNEGNIQRLQDGNGFDINDVMAEISESLTAEQLRAVQDVWDVFNALKPEIAKMERDTRNSEPIWVEPRPITLRSSDGQSVHLRGGYFPIVYDPIASTESMSLKDKEALESEIRQANAASATRQTYTKQRASRVVNRPLLFSMSNVYGSLEEIIHDLTWRKWSTDMNRVLGDRSKLSKAILNSYGEIWLRDIMDWKNRLIVDDVRAKTEFGGKIVAYAARYASSASLLYNIGSILIQPLGALTIRAATGGRAARAGLAKYLANPSEAHREAREKSPALEMRYLTRMREFADLETRIQGKSDFRRTMEVFGWQLMAKTQSIADTIAWHSGYAMAIEKGNSEARAADIAYQVVLDTQSSGRTADLSTLETGAPWKRMFAVFYRVMNTQLNLAMRSIKDRNKATASKILDMTSIFVVMPYITYLLKDLITPDEEDDPEFWTIERQAGILASETFQSAIGSFWFIRDAAALGRLFEGETPYAYRGPTGLRIIPDFFKLVEQISQGEMDKTLMKSVSSFLGDVTGAPAAAINRMIDGFSAMMKGKDVPAYSILTGTQR